MQFGSKENTLKVERATIRKIIFENFKSIWHGLLLSKTG